MIKEIKEENHKKAKKIIQEALKIDENMRFDIEFLKSLKKKHHDKYTEVARELTLVYLYNKLKDSGKIILLVDGEYIANWEKGKLAELFGEYLRIISTFGSDKKYAIVVTKTDMFEENLIWKEPEEIEKKSL